MNIPLTELQLAYDEDRLRELRLVLWHLKKAETDAIMKHDQEVAGSLRAQIDTAKVSYRKTKERVAAAQKIVTDETKAGVK